MIHDRVVVGPMLMYACGYLYNGSSLHTPHTPHMVALSGFYKVGMKVPIGQFTISSGHWHKGAALSRPAIKIF